MINNLQGNQVTLIWRVNEFFRGNEPNDSVDVLIRLTSSRDIEVNTMNNNLTNGPIIIQYAAISDLDISLL